MATLSITYAGRSGDVEIDDRISDADIRRTAVEVTRAGVGDLHLPDIAPHAFDLFVIDRFSGPDGVTVYLRPKVPFG